MDEFKIGGKTPEQMTRNELIAALKERLAVNVGLATENAQLRTATRAEGSTQTTGTPRADEVAPPTPSPANPKDPR